MNTDEILHKAGVPPHPTSTRFVIIGVDGATWDILDPMMEKGDLPHLASLKERGFHSPLETVRPTITPIIWTTVVTGRKARDHGIDGFVAYRLGKREFRERTLKLLKRVGLRSWTKVRLADGRIQRIPLSSRSRRVKTLWNIFGETGWPVGLVNWWFSWPAEAVNGYVATDRINYWRWNHKVAAERTMEGLTYPADLYDELKNLIFPPDAVTPEIIRRFMDVTEDEIEEMRSIPYELHRLQSEFKYIYALDETYRRITNHMMETRPETRFFATYFRSVDTSCHCAMKYMPRFPNSGVSDEERRKYGGVVEEFYRYTDEIIGEILARAGEDVAIIVVSDHGFEERKPGHYSHRDAPPGVLLAAGGPFAPAGRISGASIFDITPTILAAAGYPVARDMAGRVLEEGMEEEFLRDCPIRRIPSYGAPDWEARGGMESPVDEEIKERLAALGYFD
jgi:hypothetical protein